MSVSCVQIDLEPEGKVYVVIDLSGSSSEGEGSVVEIVAFTATDLLLLSPEKNDVATFRKMNTTTFTSLYAEVVFFMCFAGRFADCFTMNGRLLSAEKLQSASLLPV